MRTKTATKLTINTLKKWKHDKYKELAEILNRVVTNATNVMDCENDGFILTMDDYNNGSYTLDEIKGYSIIYMVKEWEKRYLSGIATITDTIETTFTYGNNQLVIRDINKLVKIMQQLSV